MKAIYFLNQFGSKAVLKQSQAWRKNGNLYSTIRSSYRKL
ncbi:hypothetical protein J500_3149 [Acinetobacter sp. 479375]|nr:hypothetical protein J500_3149 [Acinetobacter sp. 479375]